MFIRKTVNKSGNTSIQVMEKVDRKNVLVKHIGTARTSLELIHLSELAQKLIDKKRISKGIISLFDSRFSRPELKELMDKVNFTQVFDSATYRFLNYFYKYIGFLKLNDNCFKDLVIGRIVKPCSKRQTQKYLQEHFGKNYSLAKIYRNLKEAYKSNYQKKIEKIVYKFVRQEMKLSITVLFFDVTTLHYEAFDEDDFRKCGFSKEKKHNQPQIVVALTVTKYGMPLAMRSFKGNTFEGHTMLPCINELVQHFKLNNFIVVADSAMLSQTNTDILEKNGFKYIVGARLGNISKKIFDKVAALEKTDQNTIRIMLSNNRALVVSYSIKRARKDKSDRKKQIEKAKSLLLKSSAVVRRYKFLASRSKGKYQLNTKLIEKAKLLEGLKGYITNALELTNNEIIKKYSELWQVEKAFRISKSDLKIRPVFHTARESIESHLLLVFTALTISRYVEIISNQSIANVVRILNTVKEIIIEDNTTKETISKFTNLNSSAKKLLNLAPNLVGSLK